MTTEWMIRVTRTDGEVIETKQPSEADALRRYEDTTRRPSVKVARVELLSRPVEPWTVVDWTDTQEQS